MDPVMQWKQQTMNAVLRFSAEQFSAVPDSISVDFHPDTMVVALESVISPAEHSYASDSQGRELLERLYRGVYEEAKPILHAAVVEVTGRPVERSRFTLDSESGDAVIMLTFTKGSLPVAGSEDDSPNCSQTCSPERRGGDGRSPKEGNARP